LQRFKVSSLVSPEDPKISGFFCVNKQNVKILLIIFILI
jgi:hypothetical protein